MIYFWMASQLHLRGIVALQFPVRESTLLVQDDTIDGSGDVREFEGESTGSQLFQQPGG